MLWRPSWDHEVTGMRTKNHLERMVERTHFPLPYPINLGPHPTQGPILSLLHSGTASNKMLSDDKLWESSC